jgi:hypothetical protein
MASLLEVAEQSIDLSALPGAVDSGKADNCAIAAFHFR